VIRDDPAGIILGLDATLELSCRRLWLAMLS